MNEVSLYNLIIVLHKICNIKKHWFPRYLKSNCVQVTATRYGLDGPWIQSPVGAKFSAPAHTGPGAHPVSCKMGTRSIPGVKRPGHGVPPHLAPRLKKEQSYTSTPPLPFVACSRVNFNFTCILL